MRSVYTLLLVLLTAAGTSPLMAQSLRPADRVQSVTQEQGFEEAFDLFVATKSKAAIEELDAVGADYELFKLKADQLGTLQKSEPEALQLVLPGGLGRVDLVRANIFADGFRITESDRGGYAKVRPGLHYRGVLAKDGSSVVALSVFEEEVSAIISTENGNFVLGRMKGKRAEEHILYNDQDLPATDYGMCQTPDSNIPYSAKDLVDIDLSQKDANNCINVYMEVDNSIYVESGSTQQTTDFITGLFNQVATLYANESVNISMSELYIWTSSDPYNSNSSSSDLNTFRSTRTVFNGDVAHLVSFEASGGIAYVDVLCFPSYAYGFSSIRNGYNVVPTYSWSVNVVAHELGHNFGSQHTHACVWNGNNTALDACYSTEGGCGSSVGQPSGGGTIMSYCHLTSVGIDFTRGLGTQPGNLIRNRTYNASCLSACSPDDGGGDPGDGEDGCVESTVVIVTDFYPGETTWAITNESGAEVASGGPYSTRSTSYATDVCLPVGCYTFTINDEYGDGICCSYGNGSYIINVGSSAVANGGNFGSQTTEDFCVTGDADDGGDGGDDNPCQALSFNAYPLSSYGGRQDRGTVTVIDANTAKISGNAWKGLNLDYTVTPATRITFEFSAARKGEIHGIGFDNNSSISSNYTFQLYGTQTWGIQDFKTYTNADIDSYLEYDIPVGDFYTGTFNRLIFVNDHDRSPNNAEATFRNVRIWEGPTCIALISSTGEITPTPDAATLVNENLHVYPNPASSFLNIDVAVATDTEGTLRIMDMTGKTIITRSVILERGEQTLPLQLDKLASGAYIVRFETNSGFSATKKFSVLR